MPLRVMEGRIVGDKTNKTVTVLVERRIMDPLYKKFIRRSKKYAAHDEANVFRTGDYVKIEECPPISKSKRWRVISDAPTAQRAEKPVVAALAARAEALLNKPEAKKRAKPAAAPKAEKPKKAAVTQAAEPAAAEKKVAAKTAKPVAEPKADTAKAAAKEKPAKEASAKAAKAKKDPS